MDKPSCPNCGEILYSHANRNWKYFHRHVIDGPYPNHKPHDCLLVNLAFERDGTSIPGSDVVRFDLAERTHMKFKRNDYPNQPREDHGLNAKQLEKIFLETHCPGGEAAAVKARNAKS